LRVIHETGPSQELNYSMVQKNKAVRYGGSKMCKIFLREEFAAKSHEQADTRLRTTRVR